MRKLSALAMMAGSYVIDMDDYRYNYLGFKAPKAWTYVLNSSFAHRFCLCTLLRK